MAVNLSPVGGVAAQFFDNDGNVLSGGKIYTYTAGSSTPQATYTTGAGAIPHSNPIILNSAGRVPTGEIWLTDGISYKFVINNSVDTLIGTYDNISGINSNFVNFLAEQEIQVATANQTVFTLATTNYQPGSNTLSVFVDGVNQYGPGAQYSYLETSSTVITFNNGLHVGALVKFTTTQLLSGGTLDSSQIVYDPPFTNSVVTNVENKLSEYVSVKDFGAIGNGVADDTAAIQNAIDAFEGGIFVPKGTYSVLSTITVKNGCSLILDKGAIINYDAASGVVFQLEKNSNLIGDTSFVNLTDITWTGQAVVIDGAEQLDFENSVVISGITFVANIATAGNPTANSVALYLFSNGNQHYVSGVKVSNVSIKNFDKGILLESILGTGVFGNPATWRWVNGNVFENCFVYNCNYAFKLLGNPGPPNAVDANIFTNFIVQAFTATVEEVAEIQGNENRFDGYIWDFPQGLKQSFDFAAGTSKNVVSTNMTITGMSGEDPDNFVCRDNNTFNNIYSVSSSKSEIAASNTINSQSIALVADGTEGQIKMTGAGQFVLKVANIEILRGAGAAWMRVGLPATAGPTFGTWRVATNDDGVVSFTNAATSVGSCFDGNRNTAGSLAYFTVNSGATYVGAISTDLTVTTYDTASDYRLKENVQPMLNGLEKIALIQPKTWTWKINGTQGQGFIAHELQEHFPEAVSKEKDAIHPETGEPLYQGVDTSFIVATLVKAVQELTERIKVLEAK
jgi:hypothetical protein